MRSDSWVRVLAGLVGDFLCDCPLIHLEKHTTAMVLLSTVCLESVCVHTSAVRTVTLENDALTPVLSSFSMDADRTY